jgi:amidase
MRLLMTAIGRGVPIDGSPPPSLAVWLGMIDQQARAIRAWTAFFEAYDAVIAPVVGVTAFPHTNVPMDQRIMEIDGVTAPYGLQMAFPALGNYLNLPGTAVPVGTDPDGLPIGVQVLADRWRDHDAIALARLVHALMTG